MIGPLKSPAGQISRSAIIRSAAGVTARCCCSVSSARCAALSWSPCVLKTSPSLLEDVAIAADGLRLRIRRGKTDQVGQGAEVGLPRGRHVETCPVRAFEAWQAVARRKAGPLFRKVSTGDGIGDTALHPDAVRQILAHRVAMAGIVVDGFRPAQRACPARRLHHRGLRPGCAR
jgi:hypothetical protein